MKIIFHNKMMIFVLTILFIAPFAGIAADSWNETPALNHEFENRSVRFEPVRLKHINPSIEMLAETPDLLSGRSDKDALVHNSSNKEVEFKPEMYIETPAF